MNTKKIKKEKIPQHRTEKIVYDELSDHGYNSLPKRYQKSDGLQVHLCWVGAR